MTTPYENALFFTLETYAHTLGTRKVIEICQQFILESFPEPRALHFETDSLESSSVHTEDLPPLIPTRRTQEAKEDDDESDTSSVHTEDLPPLIPTRIHTDTGNVTPLTPQARSQMVEPPPLKRLKIKRKKPNSTPTDTTASPEAKQALAESVSPKKKEPVASKRNFKKLVDQNILPIGTVVFPSAPDPINPATAATIARTPKGQPAIVPSWDKGKFCTGTSQAPMKFLVEARKKFPTLKPYVKENAWDEVLYKHSDGSFRILSDACAQLKS